MPKKKISYQLFSEMIKCNSGLYYLFIRSPFSQTQDLSMQKAKAIIKWAFISCMQRMCICLHCQEHQEQFQGPVFKNTGKCWRVRGGKGKAWYMMLKKEQQKLTNMNSVVSQLLFLLLFQFHWSLVGRDFNLHPVRSSIMSPQLFCRHCSQSGRNV